MILSSIRVYFIDYMYRLYKKFMGAELAYSICDIEYIITATKLLEIRNYFSINIFINI